MAKYSFGQNVKPTGYNDLFGTQTEEKANGIQQISIEKLHSFKDHPFKVIDNEDMEKLTESIKENGIITPLTVRKDASGDGYQIISGHRRRHAAELAGLTEVPAHVVEIDDDTAVLQMVDSNLQRETILPSEKAFAYKMKMKALNHQGKRSDDGISTLDKISQDGDDSKSKIQRYIRLTELIPAFLDMVDNGTLKMAPAVDVSYLSSDDQQKVLDYMTKNGAKTISMMQSAKLKEYGAKEGLSDSTIELIFHPDDVKPKSYKISLNDTDIRTYFKNGTSAKEMHDIIIQALAEWKENHKEEEN